MAFTERQAKAAKWEGKDQLIAAGDGLFLNVRRSSKTWIIRRRTAGKMRVQTLGKYPTLGAKEARAAALADALKGDLANTTLKELAEDWYTNVVQAEHKRPELMRGYIDRAVIPDLGNRRVVELTPAEIATSIAGYKASGPRAADALRSVYRSILTYAIETGIRSDNPAGALTRRVAGYRPIPRDRVLTDDELRLLWTDSNPNARVIRFQLLTGLRISEAQKGHRQGDRWIVPAALSKNGRAHWVYLTKTALEQLPLPSCTATNIQSWLRRWCARYGIDPAFTPHDARRTAATRMGDAKVAPFIVERVLNHSMQGVMAVYNRAEYVEERIAAAETLDRELLAVVA
jgi:integrase